MLRRSFLKMLGLAPLIAPAVAKEAVAMVEMPVPPAVRMSIHHGIPIYEVDGGKFVSKSMVSYRKEILREFVKDNIFMKDPQWVPGQVARASKRGGENG